MNEEEGLTFDPVEYTLGEQRRAKVNAFDTFDANPDEAKRAFDLGNATGTDPKLIYPDVEGFDKQARSAITTRLLRDNDYLQQFMQDPLKAAVSNDSVGQLDVTSEALLEFSKHTSAPKEFFRAAGASALPAIGSIPAMAAGAKVGGAAGFALAGPVGGFVGALGGAGVAGFGGGYILGQVQEWLLSKMPDDVVEAIGMSPKDRWAGAKLHPTASFLGGMAPFALMFRPGGAKLVERAVSGAADAGFETAQQLITEDQINWQHVAMASIFGATFATPNRLGQPLWDQGTRAADAFISRVGPYLQAGVEPPAGLDPLVDQIKIAENEAGLASLDAALQAASETPLQQRSPEIFAQYLRLHTDANIGISPDAIKAMYGDKVPTPDDGMLGWLPDLTTQMLEADATGSDVHIPIADWLARVDPQVATVLRDFIRVRPDGLTRIEAQAEQQALSDLPPETPMELIREVAGLRPLMAPIPQSLKLERMPRESEEASWTTVYNKVGFHDFNIMTQDGKTAGWMNLSLHDGGKKLYIENISSMGVEANVFGPRNIRDLLRQIKTEFPEVETIEGFRVSGARDAAGKIDEKGRVSIKAAPTPDDLQLILDNLSKRQPYDPIMPKNAKIGGEPIEAKNGTIQPVYRFLVKNIIDVVDKSEMNDLSLALFTFFGERMKQRAGDVEVIVAKEDDITRALGEPASGYYDPNIDKIIISDAHFNGEYGKQQLTELVFEEAAHAYTLHALRADKRLMADVRDMMHETVAYLRAFNPEAMKKNEYYLKDEAEFLAAAMSRPEMQKIMAVTPLSADVAQRLGLSGFATKMGLKRQPTVWDAVKTIVKDLLESLIGVRPSETVMDGIFRTMERVEAKNEALAREGIAKAPPVDLEKVAFEKAAAIGMTVDQYNRYQKKIAEQQASDVESLAGKALEEQTKRETALWKERANAERPEALDAVNARPDVAADTFIRHGELFGQKLEGPHRIRTDSVPEEVRKTLPREYFSVNGLHPDDLAAMFGYPTGAAMVEHMEAFRAQQAATGLRPAEYKRLLVNQEIERRMRAKYGDLEENILTAAKDQVTSETQFEILHEETLGLATKAGLQFTIDQAQLKAAAQNNFSELKAADISSDKFISSAGKAGTAAETALLKGDFQEAFRQKQRQYFSMLYAREARALEKAQASFDKTAKKFSTRQVKGVAQEFTNFIHALMLSHGLKVRRTIPDVIHNIQEDGFTTLANFVDQFNSEGWEIQVSPDLMTPVTEGGAPKPIEQMTVAEFRDFKNAIDSMAYVGKEVETHNIRGEKISREELEKEIIGNLEQRPVRTPENQRGPLQKLRSMFYSFDAVLTRVEQIAKDIDFREQLGPLYRAIILPMMDAKHKEYELQERLQKELKSIRSNHGPWIKTLNDTIPQNFLYDPRDGSLFDITRANMINIMLNWGNKSNRWKFVRGYSKDKDAARDLELKLNDLFDRHATKEDWEFVQHMWNIFKGWQKDADVMYRNLSGIAPVWLETDVIKTPYGDIQGGYFPVIYDRDRAGSMGFKEPVGGRVLGPNYFRATTANNYTKERTGVARPIEFFVTLEQMAARMQQQIHDIAYRPAVVEVGKIVYNKKIMNAIRKHYGNEYEAHFEPWLKDIANKNNLDDKALSTVYRFLRGMRLNLASHALGVNLKVIFSPDMGQLNPAAVTRIMANRRANVDLAWAKSKEIPHTYRNMDRDYREQLERLIITNGWKGLRADIIRWGFTPLIKVTQGFRIITFVDEYQKALARGMADADAVAVADAFVRERHGATGVPDLPAIMRGSEPMKVMTMFYGFFSAMWNWQRQIPGAIKSRDFSYAAGALWGAVLIPSIFGAALFNKAEEDDSWFKRIGKALALQPLQTIPLVREIASKIEGFPVRSPLSTLYDTLDKGGRDVIKLISGEKVEKPIQSGANVIGLTTGLPMGQVGRSGQFLHNVQQRKERPKNIFDWWRGITFGTMKEMK